MQNHAVIVISGLKSLGLAYQMVIALGSQTDQPRGHQTGYLVTKW